PACSRSRSRRSSTGTTSPRIAPSSRAKSSRSAYPRVAVDPSRLFRRGPMGFLSGKRVLIVGVATDRSIAWGIAQAMHREGADVAFTYLNDKLKERVIPLADSLGSKLTMPMDVTRDEDIDAGFALLEREWGQIDSVIHAVAFAPREAISGSFVQNTSREAFRMAHDISSFSFTALAQRAQP